MKPRKLSRRECLAFLGSGAATLSSGLNFGSSLDFAAAAEQERQAPVDSPFQPLSNGALPIATAAWEELFQQSRVYDRTPVAQRPEQGQDHYIGGTQITLDGDWELMEADETLPPGMVPTRGSWVKVKMPAPIQYALMKAGKIPNIWYGDNFKQLQWIQQRDWLLRRRFSIPSSWSGTVVRLRFDGMDYRGAVWLDGELLGCHEGSFGGPTFDITLQASLGSEHELLVVLLHERHDPIPPYGQGEAGDNTRGAPKAVKPDALDAESYQWGNRYRTIGLYQPVRLISTHTAFLEAPFVRTDIIRPGAADLWAQCLIDNAGFAFDGAIAATIVDSSTENSVWQESYRQTIPSGLSFWNQRIELRNPKLWWPNGIGSQPLYRLRLQLASDATQCDQITPPQQNLWVVSGSGSRARV